VCKLGDRSVSLPKVWMEWINSYYEENKEALNKLEIDSPSKLVRVLANFGKPELEKTIDALKASRPSEKHES
jgi:protoheme ferro-lyase